MTRASIVGVAMAMLCLDFASFSVAAERNYGPGVSDVEIKIGQTMPYSGPVSAGGGHWQDRACLFRNDQRAGRHQWPPINFISLDDSYSPPKTMEQTRREDKNGNPSGHSELRQMRRSRDI